MQGGLDLFLGGVKKYFEITKHALSFFKKGIALGGLASGCFFDLNRKKHYTFGVF